GGWTGFEVTTLRPLAMQVSLAGLARDAVSVLDAFEEEALVDEALDAALADPSHARAFGELGEGIGFRRAVKGALAALRLGSVSPRAVEHVAFQDRDKQFLIAAVLSGFESRLAERSATDVA